MDKITVSKAFSKSTTMVILPMAFVLFGGMIITLLYGVNNNLKLFTGISGIILSFAAAILLAMYLTDKWKIWAIQRVDDVQELIYRYEHQSYFFKQRFIKTAFLTSQKDKRRLFDGFRKRLLDGTLRVELGDDINVADETVVKDSKPDNLVMGILLILFPFAMRWPDSPSPLQQKAKLIVALVILTVVYLLYKYFFGSVRMKLSDHGFWTSKTGDRRWQDVESIYITDDMEITGQGAMKKEFLVITFKPVPGMMENEPEIKLDLKKSNKNGHQIEKAIKTYLIRNQKTTKGTLIFGRN